MRWQEDPGPEAPGVLAVGHSLLVLLRPEAGAQMQGGAPAGPAACHWSAMGTPPPPPCCLYLQQALSSPLALCLDSVSGLSLDQVRQFLFDTSPEVSNSSSQPALHGALTSEQDQLCKLCSELHGLRSVTQAEEEVHRNRDCASEH